MFRRLALGRLFRAYNRMLNKQMAYFRVEDKYFELYDKLYGDAGPR